MNLRNGFGFWSRFSVYSENDGGGSGGSNVQNIEVPGPSDSDIDTLAGDDEGEDSDDDEGTDGSDNEGAGDADDGSDEETQQKPPKKKAKAEGEDFDVDVNEDDEEDSEGEEKPSKKAKGEGEEDEEADKDQPNIFKSVKEKYPKIFKEFPELRKSLGDYQRFRSIFSSVDEAVEITKQAQNFISISDQLFEGKFSDLADEMESAQKGSFPRLAKNILPTIKDKNKDLYFNITEPVIQEFLHAAFSRANASGDDKLKNSTYWLNAFLTGNKAYPGAPKDVAEDPKEKEFQERVSNFEKQKGDEAQKSVWGDIRAQLERRLEVALDPTGTKLKGKDVTKKALIKQLIGEIDEAVAGDQIHLQKVNRLWQQARRSSYSQAHLSRITNAYLERAKLVMPKLTGKVKQENGLEDTKDKHDERRDEERERPRNRQPQTPPARVTGGRPANSGQKSLRETSPRSIDWQRTSDTDVLSGRARLRSKR